VAASKRLSHRLDVMASYSATKLHQPYITNTMVNVGARASGVSI